VKRNLDVFRVKGRREEKSNTMRGEEKRGETKRERERERRRSSPQVSDNMRLRVRHARYKYNIHDDDWGFLSFKSRKNNKE